jgi:hypothetical protein
VLVRQPFLQLQAGIAACEDQNENDDGEKQSTYRFGPSLPRFLGGALAQNSGPPSNFFI